MEDITPELLEAIRKDFIELLGDATLQQLDYIGAAEYADTVGTALAEAFRRNLSGAVLPDGKMYWNIADRVVRPMLAQNHDLVADAAQVAQQTLNEAAGIGLKAQTAPLDVNRVDGILNKISSAEQYGDVAWVLDEPVKTFIRAVVDDTLRRNVEFQGKAGLLPKVIRRAESHCCEWCSKLDGTYRYPDVPKDAYRRHANCRCTVEYDPGDGSGKKTLHAAGDAAQKRAQEKARKERIEKYNALTADEKKKYDAQVAARKRYSEKARSPENVMPEYLRTATPGKSTITYDTGYDVGHHAAEMKTAQWLHDNLGGDIVLLQENLGGAKKPDYIWREKFWELKNITSAKASDSATRGALKQIAENPGGIIIDCGTNKISIADLQKIIDARVERSGKFTVDILILGQSELLKVLRYKK